MQVLSRGERPKLLDPEQADMAWHERPRNETTKPGQLVRRMGQLETKNGAERRVPFRQPIATDRDSLKGYPGLTLTDRHVFHDRLRASSPDSMAVRS